MVEQKLIVVQKMDILKKGKLVGETGNKYI